MLLLASTAMVLPAAAQNAPNPAQAAAKGLLQAADNAIGASKASRAVQHRSVSDQHCHDTQRLCHRPAQRPLRAIRAGVRHLVRDDQMMLRIHSDLHIVANDARAAPARRHRTCIRIGQRDLLIRRGEHRLLETAKEPLLRAGEARAGKQRVALAVGGSRLPNRQVIGKLARKDSGASIRSAEGVERRGVLDEGLEGVEVSDHRKSPPR
jgi:hypothetical protein